MPHRPLNEAIEHLKSGTSQVAKKVCCFPLYGVLPVAIIGRL